MTWEDVERLWVKLFYLYTQEWQCRIPERNQAPEAAVESECDAWCRRLARQLGDPLPAPPNVQPWLLARLTLAATHARSFAKIGAPVPARFSSVLAEQMLVTWYHEGLKRVWLDDSISLSE